MDLFDLAEWVFSLWRCEAPAPVIDYTTPKAMWPRTW